jgi:hypothetical protein
MTDNTYTPPTAAVEDRHATKLEAVTLLTKLLAVFNEHIDQQVERKVNEIMQSHATLALIDEKTEERIRGIAGDLIAEHEADHDHESRDDISDTVATHIAHHDFSDTIRRSVEEIISDGDYPTEERVQEMMDDIDLEEKVKEVLRNI